jgi:hypothetical protein
MVKLSFLPEPSASQVEAYRKAWAFAWKREPVRSELASNIRHAIVAAAMQPYGVPVYTVGRQRWLRVRADWREVLNRLAFEVQP